MRPEAWRLDPGAYPHSDVIQTRFGDMDPLGHLNNVAIVALFETARVRFNRATGLAQWLQPRWLVAAQAMSYLAEGSFPEDVTIAHGIGRVGGRSWTMVGAAFQQGRPIATSDVTLVIDAPEMPAAFRAALGDWQVSR